MAQLVSEFDKAEIESFQTNPPPPSHHNHLSGVSDPASPVNIDFFRRDHQVNFVVDYQTQYSNLDLNLNLGIHPNSLEYSNLDLNLNLGIHPNSFELNLGLELGCYNSNHHHEGGYVNDDDAGDLGLGLGGYEDDDGIASEPCNLVEAVDSLVGSWEDWRENGGVDIDRFECMEHDWIGEESTSAQICGDAFLFDDARGEEEERVVDDHLEWEQVDERFEGMFPEADDDDDESVAVVGEVEQGVRNQTLGYDYGWEVLLNEHNLDTIDGLGVAGVDTYFGHHGYTTAEYGMMFQQFSENDNDNVAPGRPPAAKSLIENLPSVVLAREDVENGNVFCAVCKDEMNVGERAKQLPCLHRYHGECIVPWLGITNTCPVCRYELPTDDSRHAQRRSHVANRA